MLCTFLVLHLALPWVSNLAIDFPVVRVIETWVLPLALPWVVEALVASAFRSSLPISFRKKNKDHIQDWEKSKLDIYHKKFKILETRQGKWTFVFFWKERKVLPRFPFRVVVYACMHISFYGYMPEIFSQLDLVTPFWQVLAWSLWLPGTRPRLLGFLSNSIAVFNFLKTVFNIWILLHT